MKDVSNENSPSLKQIQNHNLIFLEFLRLYERLNFGNYLKIIIWIKIEMKYKH